MLANLTCKELQELKRKAAQGDAEAQLSLGALYYYGLCVPKDEAEATKWCRKAAEQGNAEAQLHIGWLYSQGGPGMPQDEAEAAKWYYRAAEQGNTEAQENLQRLAQKWRPHLRQPPFPELFTS